MLRKFIAMGIATSVGHLAMAQDSSKVSSFTINGSADVYYRYDFQETKTNNLTSFTNSHNSFELGMASLKMNYKTPKVEMVADLGFGKRAMDFSYADEGVLSAIKQLYVSYSPSEWLKLTAGSWATHIGYELVDAYANRNYSMSYMFTNGPFLHTGVKAEASYKKNGFMIGIANPTDYKYVPEDVMNKKFLLAQYSYAFSDAVKAYLNYAGGQNPDTSKTRQFDLVLSSKFSDKFGLGFCGTINQIKGYLGNKTFDEDKSWWSNALYLNFDPSSKFGLTLREEYFSDKNGLKISGLDVDGNILSSTLSANFRLDNFIFIPEIRVDKSNKSIFIKEDGSATKTAASVLFATIFQF